MIKWLWQTSPPWYLANGGTKYRPNSSTGLTRTILLRCLLIWLTPLSGQQASIFQQGILWETISTEAHSLLTFPTLSHPTKSKQSLSSIKLIVRKTSWLQIKLAACAKWIRPILISHLIDTMQLSTRNISSVLRLASKAQAFSGC